MTNVFAISRIESYKMSDVGGVCKEASRQLPSYPNSDISMTLTPQNVTLAGEWKHDCTPEKFIQRYRLQHNIKGRFNVASSGNSKAQTNVLCQSLYSFTSDFFEGKSRDEVISIYDKCLRHFHKKFSTAVVMDAVIHFDEPGAAPHLQINWLPIAERINKKTGEKEKIFSTTILMPGKGYYRQYQDDWYSYACETFDFDFDRFKEDGSEPRKHLDLPEYKKAMQKIAEIEEKIAIYEPPALKVAEIEEIGKPAMFGGFKVSDEEMNDLRQSAKSAVISHLAIEELQREKEELIRKILEERAANARLLEDLRQVRQQLSLMRTQSDRCRAYFGVTKQPYSYDEVCFGRLDIGLQKQIDDWAGTDYAKQEMIFRHNEKLKKEKSR